MFERPTEEERPFVEAICATPADLAPRLVFADWLEDRGDRRGEYLRSAIAIEQAIDRLGWGYAFSSWRDALPHILRDQGIEDAIAPVWAATTDGWAEGPKTLRNSIQASFRCGGFVENIVPGSRTFADEGANLRMKIPLRGLLAPRYGRSVKMQDWKQSHRIWENIERIAVGVVGSRSDTDFAPFATAQSAARLTAFATSLKAAAVHLVSASGIERLAGFLNERPLKSLLILSDDNVATQNAYGLFRRWNPLDLRCLGLPHCRALDVSALAAWPGLRNLRLLDVTRYEFQERDWDTLARSAYRRDDLVILHRMGHRLCVRRLAAGRPIDLCEPRWRSTPVLEYVFDSPY